MATPAKRRPKLTLDAAAERLVDVLDRHLSRLPPKERARKLRKFYAGAKTRGTRAN
jgi:hypothetical protein